MAQETARAWCNNEVGYVAWRLPAPIPGCLGFMVTRIHYDMAGTEVERRILPAWVAFRGQSNPDWAEQDTSVWPIQKFSWRDLTLRRSRREATIRDPDFKVRYEIQPVGLAAPGRAQVPPSPTARYIRRDGSKRYDGEPIKLYLCGEPMQTNQITVTSCFGSARVAFNNGILSTQNLRKQLRTPDGQTPSKAVVQQRIKNPADPLRKFLSGDALDVFRGFFARADELDADIYLALYELADPELIDLVVAHKDRVRLILSTAGKSKDGKTWDTTNEDVRAKLAPLLGDRLQNRMFNTSKHIGHNKFGVLVAKGDPAQPLAVVTGSTNWTPTGLCGQTNNVVLVEDAGMAAAYLGYWQQLHEDVIPEPSPLGAPNSVDQGQDLRAGNAAPRPFPLASVLPAATGTAWFSPNTAKTAVPRTSPPTPPDMEQVYAAMRNAKQAILFLSFYPGQQGRNCIIGQAVEIAKARPDLLILGAISAPQAMPNYEVVKDDDGTDDDDPDAAKVPPPSIYRLKEAPRVFMVRASALRDLIGDFQRELLTAGTAIIHDKVIVIDPLSETDCLVITGSHNLGFKASYANDENMLFIRGAPEIAAAYAVHVLDVHDHYRYRAILEDKRRQKIIGTPAAAPAAPKPAPQPYHKGGGFLDTDDGWQQPYFDGRKGDELKYFVPAPVGEPAE